MSRHLSGPDVKVYVVENEQKKENLVYTKFYCYTVTTKLLEIFVFS